MIATPTTGELLTSRSSEFAELPVAGRRTQQRKATDEETTVAIEVVCFAAKAIDEIQAALDRHFARRNLSWGFLHDTRVVVRLANLGNRARASTTKVIDTSEENLYTIAKSIVVAVLGHKPRFLDQHITEERRNKNGRIN